MGRWRLLSGSRLTAKYTDIIILTPLSIFSKIFSKTTPLQLSGMTDWHCHILPGVDDGVQTMEESLEILADYEEAGIREVWLTPHIMEDLPNTTAGLRERFAELCEAYKGSVKLHLAAENMIDRLFMERLEANDLLPIGDGKTLLVETSYFSAPMHLFDTFEKIKAAGYYPLLAHPERYNYIDDFRTYRKIHDAGVRFQVNLMSLCGHYGPGPRDKALRLLSEGLVDRFGTDLHRSEHLEIISHIKLKDSVSNLITL